MQDANKLADVRGAGQVGPAETEAPKEIKDAIDRLKNMDVSPRRMFGLVPGRIVHYVMQSGKVRPFIVVDVGDSSGKSISGVLLFDSTDTIALPNEPNGYPPSFAARLSNVPFDEDGEATPGTWLWPPRQQVMAAGVDATVLESFKAELLAVMNAKLQLHLETVAKLSEPNSPENQPETVTSGDAAQAANGSS